MKYKVGDKLFFNRYGDYQECIVTSLLEKTSRYRVEFSYNSYNGLKKDNRMMNEKDLFLSVNDCIDAEINILNLQMNNLKSSIEKLNKRRT